jgi:hypothetical protein
MEVELSKEEIIAEIDKNYRGDSDMFVEIIDGCTSEYGSITDTVKRLIELLREADSITLEELIEFYKGEEPE